MSLLHAKQEGRSAASALGYKRNGSKSYTSKGISRGSLRYVLCLEFQERCTTCVPTSPFKACLN